MKTGKSRMNNMSEEVNRIIWSAVVVKKSCRSSIAAYLEMVRRACELQGNVRGMQGATPGLHGDAPGKHGGSAGRPGGAAGKVSDVHGKGGGAANKCRGVPDRHGRPAGKHGDTAGNCGNPSGNQGGIAERRGGAFGNRGRTPGMSGNTPGKLRRPYVNFSDSNADIEHSCGTDAGKVRSMIRLLHYIKDTPASRILQTNECLNTLAA